MNRRRLAIPVAAVAVTGVALVWATPMITKAVGPAGASSSSDSGGTVNIVRTAVQRDLSLTADQAQKRLTREAWATDVEAELRKELGSTFAGAWMSEDGDDLNVGVTTRAAAAEVRDAGATPRLVERSESDLKAMTRRLNTNAGDADDAVSAWYVDVAENEVVLVARPNGRSEAETLAEDSGLPDDAVRVVTSRQQPRVLGGAATGNIIGGDPYIINQAARCSVGFATTTGFVTAGHCGQVGDTTADVDGNEQGTVSLSTFPGDGDFGAVETNDNFVGQALVNDFAGGTLPVAGSEEAPVGASICRSGSTTGLRCGVVQAKNVTVNYPEGTVTGLTQTDVCAEGGDSGGSWLSGDQAQGVTSGGSGDCTVGGTTFFQPLQEILDAGNLTLITSEGEGGAGEQPPAEEEPPADGEQPPAGAGEQPPADGEQPEEPGVVCRELLFLTICREAGPNDDAASIQRGNGK
jgi:streptogrisin C